MNYKEKKGNSKKKGGGIQSKFSTFCPCTLELELGISICMYICDSLSVSVQLACVINSFLREKKKQEDGAKRSKSKRKVHKSKPIVPIHCGKTEYKYQGYLSQELSRVSLDTSLKSQRKAIIRKK